MAIVVLDGTEDKTLCNVCEKGEKFYYSIGDYCVCVYQCVCVYAIIVGRDSDK